MKKLNKNMKKNRNTIESFGCVCDTYIFVRFCISHNFQ